MQQHYRVIATGLIASLLGCASDGSNVDGPRTSCSGSEETLTCESPEARPILASRYDAARGCFETFASPSGWCAVPTNCPGGGGTTVCAVTPSGAVYLTYLLYGEATTKPDWHLDDEFVSASLLTSSEEASCKALWAALQGIVEPDGGVADERTLYAAPTSARAMPACE